MKPFVNGQPHVGEQASRRQPADEGVEQRPVAERQQGQTLAEETNEHLEEKVDESLEETFPASDPPSFNITR